MWPNPQETADLVTFTEEILNGKRHFLCSVSFETRNIKIVYYGLETITSLAPKIWDLVTQKIKDSENINTFKSNIKLSKPNDYPSIL